MSTNMATNLSEISNLSFPQLRTQCKEAGLSAKGTASELQQRLKRHLMMKKKRGAVHTSNEEPNSKRKKKEKNSIGEHLICCITLALPWDPVTALDGSVYERWAIEKYFATKGRGEVKSPAKGHMMKQDLLPAPHIKSVIETCIENGTITGDLADKWKERAKQEKEKEELLNKAEKGDVDSMELAGIQYEQGGDGFEKDKKKAFSWYKKASAAGSLVGMAREGDLLVSGDGVAKDIGMGMLLLGMAEGRGSDLAAFTLGFYMSKGTHGVPVDKVKAKLFLEKCLSGNMPHTRMRAEAMQLARKVLDKLVNEGV